MLAVKASRRATANLVARGQFLGYSVADYGGLVRPYEGGAETGMATIELQRKNMVESQVRPSDVTDRRITNAMSSLPREKFVAADAADLAYMDEAVPTSPGRAMMAPRDLARLIQLADVEADDTILVVGAGRGYAAAILARLGRTVTALECDAGAAGDIKPLLENLGISNVFPVTGALSGGWSPGAPYDAILIDGAVEVIPETLTAQLAAGGRLVAIERDRGGIGRAVVISKTGEVTARRVAFEASAPQLPGFARPAGFVF